MFSAIIGPVIVIEAWAGVCVCARGFGRCAAAVAAVVVGGEGFALNHQKKRKQVLIYWTGVWSAGARLHSIRVTHES